MARKDSNSQPMGQESEKERLPDNSLASDAKRRVTTRRKAERAMVLSNNSERVPSVRKKTKRSLAVKEDTLRVARTKSSNADSSIENSRRQLQEQKSVDNYTRREKGDPGKNNTLSIVALAMSGFFMLFILLFCIAPLKKVSYEVPVVYQDVETYIEQEPYTEIVYYSEKEPYITTEAYTVSEPYTVTEPYVVYEPRQQPQPHPPTDNTTIPQPHPLPPPPQPVIQYRQVINYRDVTNYRDILQYQDIQKSRNEIKFRPVQKQRTVIKVRQETRYRMVPILYYGIT